MEHFILILEVFSRLITRNHISCLAYIGRLLHNLRITPAKPYLRRRYIYLISVYGDQRDDPSAETFTHVAFHFRPCFLGRFPLQGNILNENPRQYSFGLAIFFTGLRPETPQPQKAYCQRKANQSLYPPFHKNHLINPI